MVEAEKMKARPPKDWSQNELERLEAGAKMKASAEEIAKSLGRPTASVRRMARSLGLVLYKKRRKAPIAAAP
jgi:transposase